MRLAKGYFGSKSRSYRIAREAVMKSQMYAFIGRRRKKRDFRRLWIARINAAARLNGMSYSSRDGENANSAILVQIFKKDFDHGHPLDGFRFQKELEKAAYRKGFAAPAQNIKDYLAHQTGTLCLSSSYPLGTTVEDIHMLFPKEINAAMEEGFHIFDRRIHGFIDQGIMVGMESRSSSPVRLVRNEAGESLTVHGLFPCGEGAGYAGGIVSSAADGLKQAENVISMINGNGI